MKKIAIFGATSDIAQEVAKIYAKERCSFFLASRNTERLTLQSRDLLLRGAKEVSTHSFDASSTEDITSAARAAFESLGKVDVLLVAYGTLPDQDIMEEDTEAAMKAFNINATSTIRLLTELGQLFKQQGFGKIGVISSVAGERGRKSNYLYGSAKAAVDTFSQGLRGRLLEHGVHVTTIRPGFVSTKMTRHIKQGPLFASPEKVASQIVGALTHEIDILYTPGFWRFIMLAIKLVPEGIFKKLSI